jgi:hypothetical protein
MGRDIRSDERPAGEEPDTSADVCPPCPACRGRGRKFVSLRRLTGAAGGAAEGDLLRQAQTECLTCAGTGRMNPAQAGD